MPEFEHDFPSEPHLTQPDFEYYNHSMPTLTFELRPREEQTAFNLRRWDEVLADPDLRKLPGRVETDRHGRVIMSPPPAPRHGRLQIDMGALLKKLLPNGITVAECPVSTADGVKGVPWAWRFDLEALRDLSGFPN